MKTMQMPKKVRQIIGMAAVVFCALGAGVAQATSTTLTYVNSPQNYQLESLIIGDSKSSVNTGAYTVRESTGSPFWVYCLDPLTSFKFNTTSITYDYTTSDLGSFVKGGGYSDLFGKVAYINRGIDGPYDLQVTDAVFAKLTELYSHAYYDSLTSINKSSAFQYAIWEIESDTRYQQGSSESLKPYTSINSGPADDMSFGSSISQPTTNDGSFAWYANSYLKALNDGSWGALSPTSNFTYTVYQSSPLGRSQTVMKVTPNAVPEPASLALFGIGVLALAASRRAARKQASVA